MIKLEESLFIGKGRTKSCYVHPDNGQKCIKVIHNPDANPKELKKELRELRRIGQRKRSSLPSQLVIPHYYGSIQTSLGKGYVFDNINSNSQTEHPTLRGYLKTKDFTSQEVHALLQRIYDLLYESAIVISELNADNLLIIEKTNSLKIALVDGFGEGSSIKLSEVHPYFARQKLKRKFIPFKEDVLTLITSPK